MKLKAGVRTADPSPGYLMTIQLTSVTKTTQGNSIKEFRIKIARGAGVAPSKPDTAAAAAADDDEPPSSPGLVNYERRQHD